MAKSVAVAVLVTVGVVVVVGPILDRHSFLHVQERQQQQQTNRDMREMNKNEPSMVEIGGKAVMAAVVEKTPTMVEGEAVRSEVARLQRKIKFLEGNMLTMLIKLSGH